MLHGVAAPPAQEKLKQLVRDNLEILAAVLAQQKIDPQEAKRYTHTRTNRMTS